MKIHAISVVKDGDTICLRIFESWKQKGLVNKCIVCVCDNDEQTHVEENEYYMYSML